jgi:hypothetical protein
MGALPLVLATLHTILPEHSLNRALVRLAWQERTRRRCRWEVVEHKPCVGNLLQVCVCGCSRRILALGGHDRLDAPMRADEFERTRGPDVRNARRKVCPE